NAFRTRERSEKSCFRNCQWLRCDATRQLFLPKHRTFLVEQVREVVERRCEQRITCEYDSFDAGACSFAPPQTTFIGAHCVNVTVARAEEDTLISNSHR